MSDQTPGAPQDPQQPAQPPAEQPPAPQQPAPQQPAPPAQPPVEQPPAQAPVPPVQQQPAPQQPAQQPAAQPPVPPQQPAQQYAPPPQQYAAPAQPGAPVPPPPGYAAPASPPPGGLFKSGQTKTIALIVGGVVAVGVIGGVAALLAGGGDDKEDVSTTASAPEGSGVLDPAPVGNTDPAEPSEEPTTEPSEEPTAEPSPTEEPTPEPSPEPPPASGDAVTIGGDIAVPVPSGWQVLGSGENDVALSDGAKNYVYAITGQVDPSADAGQVLRNTLDTVVPPDQYPDLRTSDVLPQTPGGSIVSLALLEYEGTWTDGQGTTPVHGAVFAAVRQDGTALVILGEHTPPKEFAKIWASELQPVVDGILLPFAGLG